jgi:Tfp pilus assembly protein FimT
MAILAVVAALLLPCVVRTYKAARTKLAGVQLFHKLQLAQELDQ